MKDKSIINKPYNMNRVEALAELTLNANAEVRQNGVVNPSTLNQISNLIDQMSEDEMEQARQLYSKLDPRRVEGSTD